MRLFYYKDMETQLLEKKKILIICPHGDDGELGCGGSIARLIAEGKEVYYLALSIASASMPEGFKRDALKAEMERATDKLGIDRNHLIIFDYPVREFPKNRQEILEDLIKIKKEINPDVIFVPSLNDIHQDHKVVAEECLRAFKNQTIFGYEEPWNNIIFETRCFIPLLREHIEKKVEALHCYESQKYRTYLKDDFVWSLARTRGTQIEGEYAEAFEVVRLVFDKK